jgi:hypothetical protein
MQSLWMIVNLEVISILIARQLMPTMLPAQALVVTYQPSQKVLSEEGQPLQSFYQHVRGYSVNSNWSCGRGNSDNCCFLLPDLFSYSLFVLLISLISMSLGSSVRTGNLWVQEIDLEELHVFVLMLVVQIVSLISVTLIFFGDRV